MLRLGHRFWEAGGELCQHIERYVWLDYILQSLQGAKNGACRPMKSFGGGQRKVGGRGRLPLLPLEQMMPLVQAGPKYL